MHLYLDGYKDGANTHSWKASMFFIDREKSKNASIKNGMLSIENPDELPPVDTKLTHKQIVEYGFFDWLGKTAPKLDYYILKYYGKTQSNGDAP